MVPVAPGRIATVTGPIAYTETDANGKVVADTVIFNVGDVIHDEALVQTLHAKGFHHALSVTHHTPHLCPDDCEKIAVAKPVQLQVPTSAPEATSLSNAAATLAASIPPASTVEVK